MIEEIPNVRLEIGNIKLPAVDRNRQSELALFVPFAAKRQEIEAFVDGLLQERSRNREKRRSLIVAAVEGAENPVELWHAKSSAHARIDVVFGEPTRKMCVAEPAVESEPIGDAVLVFGEERKEPASWVFRLAERRTGAVGGHEAKECVVLLRESVETGACIVPATRDSQSREATFIVRVMVIGWNDPCVLAAGRQIRIWSIVTVIGGAIPMIERRERSENAGLDGVHPGEISEDVPFALNIAYANELLIGRVWNLKIVRSSRPDEAKLICLRRVENQRSEPANAVIIVVQLLRFRRHQAHIRAIHAKAPVIRETIRVIADADLAVGGMETAVGGSEFDFTAAFESGARNDIEDTVSPVTVLRGVTAALNLHDIDVLGVELRADVGSNVCVRNGHAVDQPGNLVAAANVQLVVNHVGPGCVGCNEFEAVRSGSAWGGLNVLTRECCRRGGESCVNRLRGITDLHTLMYRSQFHRKVKKRRGIREDGQVRLHIAEAVSDDVDCVQAGGHGVHLKTSLPVRSGFLFPVGLLCLQ